MGTNGTAKNAYNFHWHMNDFGPMMFEPNSWVQDWLQRPVGIVLLGRVIDAQTFEQLMAFDPLGVGLVLARNDQKEASWRRFHDSLCPKNNSKND